VYCPRKGYFIAVFDVITERKNKDAEIARMNEDLELRVKLRTMQLESANKELEAFSYSVSHDLRAPLRHINGYVDLLKERFQESIPDKAQHYLNTITTSTRQMGKLIDDLLNFSRSGRQELQQSAFKMDILLHEVLQQVKQDIKDRKIEWNISVLPYVYGDQDLLRMVWYNLLGNAVKFTREKEVAFIDIGVAEEEKEMIFSIRDNGAGFDMKYANKLFGVFQRLHSAEEFEGTGVGLANVQRIIAKHGGRTWAEAQLLKGATFYFSLPKKQ
jgi:light-regulated signal transduction histidine kinase (bacteriophytochrome)